MDARLLVRSKFMVSREFGTGDIPAEPLVTIAGVKKPDEEEDNTKGWWLVYFVEKWAKPLKVNGTHREALALMFGWETDLWKGKRVSLYTIVGTFFGRRQTAVRIKGSPDLTEPRSFSIQKFGGGKDVYNLIPINAGAQANGKKSNPKSAPYTPGIVWWGPSKGIEIAQLTHAELSTQIAKYKEWLSGAAPTTTGLASTKANLVELEADLSRRADLERAMDANTGAIPQDEEPPL